MPRHSPFRQQRCRDGGWEAFGMTDSRGYCANGTASGMDACGDRHGAQQIRFWGCALTATVLKVKSLAGSGEVSAKAR